VRFVGWGVALVCLGLAGAIPGIIGRERFAATAARHEKTPFFASIREVFSNRSFVMLFAIVLTTYLVGMMASSMDHYLLVYYVCHGDLTEGSFWKAKLSTAYGVVGFLSIPLLTYISKRIGKETTMIAVLCLLIVGACARWWIFRPGAGWWIVLDPFLGGGALWVAMGMVVQSMFADICDEDELAHGQRREGLFGGAFSWLIKTGTSLAYLISGQTLNWIGFKHDLGANQTPSAIFSMRLFLCAAPAVAAIACIIMLKCYPLTKARAIETRRLLEARRGVI